MTARRRVTPGGFGTVASPDLRVEHLELVTPTARLPLGGTFAGLARAAGVEARSLRDVYSGGPGIDQDDPLIVDTGAAVVLLEAFATGEAALRRFAPDLERVLWPEHFDLGITAGAINYGASPGDAEVADPYLYVGPHDGPPPGEPAFWNAPFGAVRTIGQIGAAADAAAFFRDGRARVLAHVTATP